MKTRGKLTKESIVEMALKLLDVDGVEKFSMRKLAAELQVDPMALYYHYANKSDLINAVIQSMMEKCELPESGENWQEDIRNVCWSFRRLAQKHPGSFRLYETYDEWVPAEHELHEAFHSILLKAGFSKQRTVQAVRLLLAYTEAIAIDEISGWYGSDIRSQLIDNLKQGQHPTQISLIEEIGTIDADADFEFGLDVLIRGLEAEVGYLS